MTQEHDCIFCGIVAGDLPSTTIAETDGINLLNCSGEAAWQTVFHVHIHVIPRYKYQLGKDCIGLPWERAPSDPDQIVQLGKLLS